MKRILSMILALCLALPTFAFAQDAEPDLNIDRDVTADDYVGTWVLTGAYLAGEGALSVAPEAIALELEAKIQYNILVNVAAYIHANVTNLQGKLSFDHSEIDVDDYRCNSDWNQFGSGTSTGAARIRIQDDGQGMFFSVITGADVRDGDMELMDVIAMNAAGQLILGYSEDHIEVDDSAAWEYAYIFDRVRE